MRRFRTSRRSFFLVYYYSISSLIFPLRVPSVVSGASETTSLNYKNLSSRASTAAFHTNTPPPADEPPIMRAWTCHGRNQRDLVDRLRQANIVQTPAVQAVLYQTDRIHYSPPNSNPYQDAPQVLGWGQTISAPHMHAHALEEIFPYLRKQRETHPNDPLKVLDVGCGSGYLTAAMGRWFQSPPPPTTTTSTTSAPSSSNQIVPGLLGSGSVYGIDIHPQLVQIATDNIRKRDGDLLQTGVVKMQTGNGWEGLLEAAPYDAIHVGASAAEFPSQLARQLKPGGVMIIPVGPQSGAQHLYRVERLVKSAATATTSVVAKEFDPSEYQITKLLGVRYVPLVHQPGARE